MNNLMLFFLLNLLDGALTVIWYAGGGSEELNPLMGALLAHSLVLFMLVKTSIGIVVCGALYYARHSHYTPRVLNCAVAVYAILLAMHLWVLRTA